MKARREEDVLKQHVVCGSLLERQILRPPPRPTELAALRRKSGVLGYNTDSENSNVNKHPETLPLNHNLCSFSLFQPTSMALGNLYVYSWTQLHSTQHCLLPISQSPCMSGLPRASHWQISLIWNLTSLHTTEDIPLTLRPSILASLINNLGPLERTKR